MTTGLPTYAGHCPTCCDKHIKLEDREDRLLASFTQTRDSGPLDRCNFKIAVDLLGGESETVEVHRFGHWGPGWYEIIIVDPQSDEASTLYDLERVIEYYPILDDAAWEETKHCEFIETWKAFGSGEFTNSLSAMLIDSDGVAADMLEDVDSDIALKFWEDREGEYHSTNEGIRINTPEVSRDDLADFLWTNRPGKNGKWNRGLIPDLQHRLRECMV